MLKLVQSTFVLISAGLIVAACDGSVPTKKTAGNYEVDSIAESELDRIEAELAQGGPNGDEDQELNRSNYDRSKKSELIAGDEKDIKFPAGTDGASRGKVAQEVKATELEPVVTSTYAPVAVTETTMATPTTVKVEPASDAK